MNEEEAREELKKHISLVNKDYAISDYCEKCGNIEALGTVLTLLEKKDKIIDLMLQDMLDQKCYSTSRTILKKIYERKVENGN